MLKDFIIMNDISARMDTIEVKKEHPNRDKLEPFLGRTFTGNKLTVTASNIIVWDLINKLTEDKFREQVKNEVHNMGQKSKFPLRAHHIKSKDHIFAAIVKELLEYIHKETRESLDRKIEETTEEMTMFHKEMYKETSESLDREIEERTKYKEMYYEQYEYYYHQMGHKL